MCILKSSSTIIRSIIAIAMLNGFIVASDVNTIDEISVNKNITIPRSAKFLGLGSMLGPGLIELNDRNRDQILTDIFTKNSIDVGNIIYTAFSNELHNTTFNSKLKDDAKFQFIIEVTDYGLAKGWGLGNNMRPLVRLKAKIIDSNNNKLWGNSSSVWGGTNLCLLRKRLNG